MSRGELIENIEHAFLKKDIPSFRIGDTIKVQTRIVEGNKERVQVISGTVIAKKGSGLSTTFSIHRISHGQGMEKVFLLHSPKIAKIEVTRVGKVRQSKLYYLRGCTGKRAKVEERVVHKSKNV